MKSNMADLSAKVAKMEEAMEEKKEEVMEEKKEEAMEVDQKSDGCKSDKSGEVEELNL